MESRSNPVSWEGYARGGRKALPVLGILAVMLALLVALSSSSVRPAAAAAAGTVESWGNNSNGQLGYDPDTSTIITEDSATPGQVSSLTDVKDVAAGGRHSLALKNDGTVWAWGNNFFGQLGNGNSGLGSGNNTDSSVPVQVKGENGVGFLTNIKAIAAGGGHGLALKNGGTVRAWGYNFFGQLGDGNSGDDPDNNPGDGFPDDPRISATPVKVKTPGGSPLKGVTAIAAGANHSLALKTNGTMRAWGFNGYGQLGNGDKTDRSLPVTVRTSNGSTFKGVKAIAGGERHSLALKTSGAVWAWDNNFESQLGNGSTGGNSDTPGQVSGLANVAAIARGPNADHGLAVGQ